MNRQLVFIHGRAQEGKDSIKLKSDWISAWEEGLKLNDLKLPIPETDIRFPYYGQTLFDLVNDVADPAEVIVRGVAGDPIKEEFVRAVLLEAKEAAGVTDAKVEAVTGAEFQERGALNWPWVRGILQAIDQVPGLSSGSIALATNDVYEYLNTPGIRDTLESGVLQAMKPDVETVVVSHSLGTVVAYNLLRREGKSQKWKVPLFVTLGSPLAVTAIKKALRPIGHPDCVGKWYNAMDPRDIVSLHPLDAGHFGIDPAIDNHISVQNQTENRHGIEGYLDDKQVAKRIYDALMA